MNRNVKSLLWIFFLTCVLSGSFSVTPNQTSPITPDRKPPAQEESADLSFLLSAVDTSNLVEVFSGLQNPGASQNVPLKIDKGSLLKTLSENATSTTSISWANTITQNSLIEPINPSIAMVPSPPPAEKVVFTRKPKNIYSLATWKPAVQLLTRNQVAKVRPKPPTDNWKDFKWEEWEEPEDPLAVLKTPPNIDGFGEIKFYSLQVNADTNNRANALKDKVYTNLLRKIKEVDFQVDYRFNLLIQAKINEEVEVNYNIVQDPDANINKTDVALKIRKTLINFGYVDKKYALGQFTNISRKIDGISIIGSEGPFSYNFGFGAEKSKTDEFTRSGNGKNEYELRNKPVLQNSLKVWVNDIPLAENVDYQINYFEGKVIFKTAKSSNDTLKFHYQYTNPIEEFIPIASNINLFGFTGGYSEKNLILNEPRYKNVSESFSSITTNRLIQLKNAPIKFASEKVFMDGTELSHNKDYYVHYKRGTILILNPLIKNFDITYLVPDTINRASSFQGSDSRIVYYLPHKPILEGSERIMVQDRKYERDLDYKIDYANGRVIFLYPIPKTEKIIVDYKEQLYQLTRVAENPDAANYDLKVGYFRQFAKSQKELNTRLVSDTRISTSNFGTPLTLNLSYWPVVEDSLAILVNQTLLTSANASISLNRYSGAITINSALLNVTGTILVNYSFYKEYGPSQWNFAGSDTELNSNVEHNSRAAHQIQSKLSHPVKFDRYGSQIKVEYKKTGELVYLPLVFGKDYTVQYVDDGVNDGQIQLTFYKEYYDENNVKYGVPIDLASDDLFRVTYYYNKSNVPDPGEISNEQFEMVYSQSFSNDIDLTLDIARTRRQFARAFQSTTNAIAANGDYGQTYSLTKTNIVEDSEVVYLNNNIAIKNENYYINYNSGKLTFINLNPGPSDNVYVDYSFYTSSSGENLEAVTEEGNAVSLKSNIKNNFHSTQFELLAIDDAFSPIGASRYAAGSNIFRVKSALNPRKDLKVNASYFRNRKKTTNTDAQGNILFQNETKYDVDTTYTPESDTKIRYKLDVIDNQADRDKTATHNVYNVDNIKYTHLVALEHGPQEFNTKFSLSQFDFTDDYLDRILIRKKTGNNWQLVNRLSLLKKRLILESELSQTSELHTSENQKQLESLNSKGQFKINYKPNSAIALNTNYKQEFSDKKTGFDGNNVVLSSNHTQSELKNYQINFSLTPEMKNFWFYRPKYHYNLTNTEKDSLLLQSRADTNYILSHRLSWGIQNFTNLSFKNSHSDSLESNRRIGKRNNLEEFSISGFSLLDDISPIKVRKLYRKFSQTRSYNSIGNKTTLETTGRNYTNQSTYGVGWKPASYFETEITYTEDNLNAHTTENTTAEIIYSTQTKPKHTLKAVNKIKAFDVIDTTYTFEQNTDKFRKITVYMPSQNVNSINNLIINNKTSHKQVHDFKHILFPKTYKIQFQSNYLYDDFIDSTQGLKSRNKETHRLNHQFKAFDLTFKPSLKLDKTLQYRRVSDDIDLDLVKSRYTSFLDSTLIDGEIDTIVPITEKYSLLVNYGFQLIYENDFSRPTPDHQVVSIDRKSFGSHSFGLGIQTLLFDDVLFSYTYTLKMNQDLRSQRSETSLGDTIKLSYKPTKLAINNSAESFLDIVLIILSKTTFNFEREHNWGVGLNDFSKRENNDLNAISIGTELSSIDNITTFGSIETKIEIPLAERSNGLIEKFVFTTEGKIVEKLDLKNRDNGINYTVTGLLFSGKLIF